MKCYVAGSYQHRLDIDRLVDKIKQHIPDFECTSTWIRQGEEDDLLKKKGHQYFIDLDRVDIGRADVFVLINTYQLSKHSTGKWVELGIAMELELQLVVWGTLQDSLFIHGRDTIIVESSDEIDLIKALDIVSKVMIKREQDAYNAYRTVSGATDGGPRVTTPADSGENRGEDVGPGIRDGESSSLHDLDRAFANRTQGLGGEEGRTRGKYSPVGTPISQIEP